MREIQFQQVKLQDIESLKTEWLTTLTSPQDGMWEAFRDGSQIIQIQANNVVSGYACLNDSNELIQFYLIQEVRRDSASVLNALLKEYNITTAIAGTNNPVFLSAALEKASASTIHTYLFRDFIEVPNTEKAEELKLCSKSDLEEVVAFCEDSTGAPREWLMHYIGNLIERGEVLALRNESEIIGTCEVRKSDTTPSYADIGMIVSPDFRQKGYGTYLLNSAKSIAIGWGKIPICSCERDNVGSLKSIRSCGFFSDFQLLLITFD